MGEIPLLAHEPPPDAERRALSCRRGRCERLSVRKLPRYPILTPLLVLFFSLRKATPETKTMVG